MNWSTILLAVVSFEILFTTTAGTFYIEQRTRIKKGGGGDGNALKGTESPQTQIKDVVTLYSCENVEGQTPSIKCTSIKTQSERQKVLSSVNFYQIIAPQTEKQGRILILDGKTQREPLPNLVMGFDPSAVDSPHFQHFSSKYEQLNGIVSKDLLPYGPDEYDTFADVTKLFSINDVSVFSKETSLATQYLSAYLSKLRRVLNVQKTGKAYFQTTEPPITSYLVNPTTQQAKSIVALFMYKMFDPCAVLNRGSGTYCSSFCQFVGLAAKTFTNRMPSKCSMLTFGSCSGAFCTCSQEKPPARKGASSPGTPRSAVKMVECNNEFRMNAN